MMYIIDQTSISPQNSSDDSIFEGRIEQHTGTKYIALEPDYTGLIPAGLLRRMGKAVRMGVGAGLKLLKHHPAVEGIILGTANGGLEDCLKFLNQIVDYNEGTLTPTNFVQSTPNAVAGNLALMKRVTGYNMTHVHKGLAFENALLDAIMLLDEGKYRQLLVGSIEEISAYNYNIDALRGYFKLEDSNSGTLLTAGTPGSVHGEGSCWFVVSSEQTEGALAELVDIGQAGNLAIDEVSYWISDFLSKNSLAVSDIDLLISGRSGDSDSDGFYTNLEDHLLQEAPVAVFKNLVGEYPTAASFALWMAANILAGKTVPDVCRWKREFSGVCRNVLIYNQLRGEQHGLMLLRGL